MQSLHTLKKFIPVLTLAFLLAGGLVAGCASGPDMQVEAPGEAYDWDVWDEDDDDRLSDDEFAIALDGTRAWADWDLDGDGYLDEDEWDAATGDAEWSDDWGNFGDWDADDDLRLTEDEWAGGFWDVFDDNDDDWVDENEWNTYADDWGWDADM